MAGIIEKNNDAMNFIPLLGHQNQCKMTTSVFTETENYLAKKNIIHARINIENKKQKHRSKIRIRRSSVDRI
ncbi:MAG: hypothetical protein ACLGJC_18925 [Alphaproteobacteria bacterium]